MKIIKELVSVLTFSSLLTVSSLSFSQDDMAALGMRLAELKAELQLVEDEQNIENLQRTYGYNDKQAYHLCSVAVNLHVSQVVDLPNVLVTAFLPLDIFTD